jgi:hypothetical protein
MSSLANDLRVDRRSSHYGPITQWFREVVQVAGSIYCSIAFQIVTWGMNEQVGPLSFQIPEEGEMRKRVCLRNVAIHANVCYMRCE